jgi:NTE family protein
VPAPTSGPKPRIGLVLGSGAARGWAHLGVIRELEAAGYRPDIVCGASIGALVGAAYADGDLDPFERWVRGLDWKAVLGFFDVGFGGGLLKGEKLMAFFAKHFVDKDFSALPMPFACVATDLATGREVWLREGGVAAAVRASMALPGLLAPQYRDGHWLVDGGLVNPVPVSLCRAMGAEIVIAVDLGTDLVGRRRRVRRQAGEQQSPGWSGRLRDWIGGSGRGGPDGEPGAPAMLDVLTTSLNIMQGRIARSRMAGEPADVVVTPRVAQLGLLDFHRGSEAIAEGAEAMRIMLPVLQRTLEDA